jgi:hypothetical protein
MKFESIIYIEDKSVLVERREKEVIGVGQRKSWRRRVKEWPLSFEVQPSLPFLLCFFFFCYFFVTLWPFEFLIMNG